MRIYGRIGDPGRQGNRALKKNLKKCRRGGRSPKTAKLPISPRRVVVFKPSAILKHRINGPALDGERQGPAKQFVGSVSRNTH
jgi:hypothetical protein